MSTQSITVVSPIYGAEWDGTATTAWTRTDGAANFADPIPAVNNGDGSSPFDNISPWKDIRRIEDETAGTLVEIPKFYYKWTRDGSKMKLQISSKEFDGAFVSPAHADRGDGEGERDVVYVGAYHCVGTTFKSTSGATPYGNYTRAQYRNVIHANLGSDVWQWDFAMWWTINMLYLVEYADWNSQAKIGYGCGNGSSVQNNGLTDSMTYHTGTNASTRTSYGHTRYRYIEDLWGNVYDWCDGIYFSAARVYCIKNPANFSDTTGGTQTGTRATTSNITSAWSTPNASGFEYALCPSATNGSYSSYICDGYDYGSTGVVLYVGYFHSQSESAGIFSMISNGTASEKSSSIGSRLMKLPASA